MLSIRRIPFCRIQCGEVQVRGGWMHLADEGYPDLWTPLTWLETKTPEGKLNDAQINRHEELRAWGERIEVVTNAKQASELIDALTMDFRRIS
jgi:hypothetical protein